MPDIQQRIADILGDEWTDDIGPAEWSDFKNIQQWADHVAEVLVSELGLTRENRIPEQPEPGERMHHVPASRYVTEWVPE